MTSTAEHATVRVRRARKAFRARERAGELLLLLPLLTIMAVAVDRRAPKGWAGLIIGLAVAGAILVIAPLTGGSLNPARTFGPNLVQTLFGEGQRELAHEQAERVSSKPLSFAPLVRAVERKLG